jgi:hypothetical protein
MVQEPRQAAEEKETVLKRFRDSVEVPHSQTP